MRVAAVDGDRLTCRVTDAYFHEDALVPSQTLAFQFLWDAWERLTMGLADGLPDEATAKQAQEQARLSPIGRELVGQDSCDEDWVRANAGRFVRHVEVKDHINCDYQKWSADDGVKPQATYVITVTEPRWLAHLVPGMEWDTASYNMDNKN